jgi:site-specific recombinase XerD
MTVEWRHNLDQPDIAGRPIAVAAPSGECARHPLHGGTMNQLIDEYLAERQARGEYTALSVGVVRSILTIFARYCQTHDITVADVSRRTIEEFLASDPTLKAATKQGRIGKLRPFFTWLVATDRIAKDPTLMVRGPKARKPLPRDIDRDAVARIIEAAGIDDDYEIAARNRLIVILMVQCGLRCKEVSAINMDDVDVRERTLDVRGKNGAGDVTRVVSIPAEAWRFITEYLTIRPTFSGPLIRAAQTPNRLLAGTVSRIMSRLFTDAGVKNSPRDGMSAHALRHTFAQDLIESGADIRVIQAGLGHSSVSTTEIYLRRKPPGLAEAMEGRTYAV